MNGYKNENCVFCKIISGDDYARVVYESREILAFFPSAPATRGHTLVVPKRHVDDIWSLDTGLGASLLSVVLLLSRAVRDSLNPEGLNVLTSAGEAASQTIYHLHFHVVPRWRDDDMGDIWPPKKTWADAELDDLAGAVRAACAGLEL